MQNNWSMTINRNGQWYQAQKRSARHLAADSIVERLHHYGTSAQQPDVHVSPAKLPFVTA